MDTSILTTPNEFEKKPLRKAVDTTTKVVNDLFHTTEGKPCQNVSEDTIADAIVDDIINKISLPNELRAALSHDNCAILYPKNVFPKDGHGPDWTHLRFFIKFKEGGAANDSYDDKNEQISESWAHSWAEVHGQLFAYASNTFQHQHRTALYSLLVNGHEFRGMYWDRSGLVVTEATNYVKDPGSLLRFLWVFASLTEESQGIDSTATLLSENSDDYKLMDTWARADPNLDALFHECDDVSRWFPAMASGTLSSGRWPRYRLLVGKDERQFLVARPPFMSASIFGRGTRGYITLDVKTKKFVFLKDSWKPFYEGVEPEGNYLQTIAFKPGLKLTVPTVIQHGNVLNQTTLAAEYITLKQSQSLGTPSA